MAGFYATLIFTALGTGAFLYFFFKSATYNEAAEKYNAQLRKEEEIYAALTANENE